MGEDTLRFSGDPLGEACTVVIHGATQQIIDEADHSLHAALRVLAANFKEARIVYDGGCRETDPENIETLDEKEVNVDMDCLPENDRHKLVAQHIKDCNDKSYDHGQPRKRFGPKRPHYLRKDKPKNEDYLRNRQTNYHDQFNAHLRDIFNALETHPTFKCRHFRRTLVAIPKA
ncbi:conserved hypothetical protein [Culex quinquefasciatus]|uniref:Uncharacterized protein n=1 Tax=Culex quinquefasciatus TaxID=7176 RepID=B0X8D4_CULQU|nr:conserved hypothetical protein [Culex quinquefasciatus]|eukprot:XP_001865906.1 conserved hypothetical protein [Culex quinquefasciatus]